MSLRPGTWACGGTATPFDVLFKNKYLGCIISPGINLSLKTLTSRASLIPEVNLKKILIIDFGSQFTQLIARRIRELGIYSEIIIHKNLSLLLKLNFH